MTLLKFGLAVLLAVSPFFLSANNSKVDHLDQTAVQKPFLYVAKNESQFNKIIEEQIKNHQKGAKSQKQISSLAEKTRDIISEYEVTLRQIESVRSYNNQLKKLIKDQKNEMSSIRLQIVEVKQTGKDIIPLMLKMTKNLEEFINLDIPFLMKERKKRLEEIKKIMDRADVSVSEKYRRLMEAYQIENEYGKTLETYQGIQKIKGKKLSVNYLRIGRIALIYQTLDGKKQGLWNQKSKKWEPLTSRYSREITKGLKMAKNQQPPDLLTIPIPAPVKTILVKADKNNIIQKEEDKSPTKEINESKLENKKKENNLKEKSISKSVKEKKEISPVTKEKKNE